MLDLIIDFLKVTFFVYLMMTFMPIIVVRHFPDHLKKHLLWALPKAMIMSGLLVFGKGNYGAALIAGGIMCGGLASLNGFDKGLRIGLIEPVMILCMIFGMAFAFKDGSGFLGASWFMRQLGHVQREFAQFGVPVTREFLGYFTAGSVAGAVLFLPGRIFVKVRAAHLAEAEKKMRAAGRIPDREKARKQGVRLARKDKRSAFQKRLDDVAGTAPIIVKAD